MKLEREKRKEAKEGVEEEVRKEGGNVVGKK